MARARAIATNSSAAASSPHPRASSQRFRAFLAALAAALLAVPIGLAVMPDASAAPAPTGIFANTLAPTVAVDPDRVPVELGVKFRPQSSGRVTALQYYQGRGARGVTDATLWSASGTVLARVSFATTTEVGWRTVPLAKPVGLTAGSAYVVSYHAPRGGYPTIERDLLTAKTLNGFELPARAGVYTYGSAIAFPTSTYAGTNYLVDVVFQPATTTSTATQQPTEADRNHQTPDPRPQRSSPPRPQRSSPPRPQRSSPPRPQRSSPPRPQRSSPPRPPRPLQRRRPPVDSSSWAGASQTPTQLEFPRGRRPPPTLGPAPSRQTTSSSTRRSSTATCASWLRASRSRVRSSTATSTATRTTSTAPSRSPTAKSGCRRRA